ncbi:MAG: sugar ABC transporter substrate-binding protein [Bryobacterales bacterium]|nr:sugar ABC transporter substrate-binding protein [Bryobacterales bacterium]
MKFSRIIFALFAILALAASACGNDDDGESAAPQATAAAPEATAAAPEATAAAPQATAAAPQATAAPAAPDEPESEPLVIGYANQGVAFAFNAAIADGVSDAADAAGIRLLVLDAEGESAQQANDIQDLIAQEVDGVLLGATDSTVATGFVDDLEEAGIPVVAIATQVGDPSTREQSDVYEGLVALVTQNEVAAGETAGRIALNLLPEGGEVAIIEGLTGQAQVELRARNFLTPAEAAGVTFDIVSRQPGNWSQDTAEGVCQNIFAANPDIDLIYAQNDPMAIGCGAAAEAAGLDVQIIGVGGSGIGIAAIEEGTIQATVCYQPFTMGSLGLQTLIDHINGDAVLDAEFINYDTPGITSDNLDDCIPQW